MTEEAKAAIKRVEVFHDSIELANYLNERDDYLSKECAVHIEGLWKLTKELAKHLKAAA